MRRGLLVLLALGACNTAPEPTTDVDVAYLGDGPYVDPAVFGVELVAGGVRRVLSGTELQSSALLRSARSGRVDVPVDGAMQVTLFLRGANDDTLARWRRSFELKPNLHFNFIAIGTVRQVPFGPCFSAEKVPFGRAGASAVDTLAVAWAIEPVGRPTRPRQGAQLPPVC